MKNKVKLLSFCSSFLLSIIINSFSQKLSIAAEQITIQKGTFSVSIPVDELERYSQVGTVSSKYQSFLSLIETEKYWLRDLLKTSYALDNNKSKNLVEIDRIINSPEGKVFIELFGETFLTESRSNGSKAIKASIIKSISNSQDLTAIDLIRNFTGQRIIVDVNKAFELSTKLKHIGLTLKEISKSEITNTWVASIPFNLNQLTSLPSYGSATLKPEDALIRQEFFNWLLGNVNAKNSAQKFRESLALRQKNQDKLGEGLISLVLGWYNMYLHNRTKAVERNLHALNIFSNEVDFPPGKALTLTSLGFSYFQLGRYQEAMKYYLEADKIYQSPEFKNINLSSENFIKKFIHVGIIDFSVPELAKLISQYVGKAVLYQNIGSIYGYSNPKKAISYYKKSLEIHRQTGFVDIEQWQLWYLGELYYRLSFRRDGTHYKQKTLETIELSESIEKQRRKSKGFTFKMPGRNVSLNTGMFGESIFDLKFRFWLDLKKYKEIKEALDEYVVDQFNRNRSPASERLVDIYNKYGILYLEQANNIQRNNHVGLPKPLYKKSQGYFLKSLVKAKESNDRELISQAFFDVGRTWEALGNKTIAIIFYKQSINQTQGIIGETIVLPINVRKAYVSSVEYRYRKLANLLLEQGRLLEAQKVLELIKIDELRKIVSTRSTGQQIFIEIKPFEQKVIDEYGSLIEFERLLIACNLTCPDHFTLFNEKEALSQELSSLFKSLEDERIKAVKSGRVDIDPDTFKEKLSKIKSILDAQPNSALIYTFSAEDKLWIFWAHGGETIGKFGVNISGKDFRVAIGRYRELIQNKEEDIRNINREGKQIYDWIIAPIQKELDDSKIKNLIFVLDGYTRYIPMATLYDGKQYLVEKYQISRIISANLNRKIIKPLIDPSQSSILAAGVYNYPYKVPEHEKTLKHVKDELQSIVRENEDSKDAEGYFPGKILLNKKFTKSSFLDNAQDFQILHIATHYTLNAGKPEESLLTTGQGNMTHKDLIDSPKWSEKIYLAVLSACNTATPFYQDNARSDREGNGREVNALAQTFIGKGVEAVVASLWKVDDESTSQFMKQFYKNLASSEMSTAGSIKKVQEAMIKGSIHSSTNNSDSTLTKQKGNNNEQNLSGDYRHPYYWAPFILTGNRL